MDQSQVFRAMMPGLTSANGARIAVAYPSFPRPLPLVRLDRRAVFRAAGAAPLVCGLPRAATLLVADEPLCSLRLVIRDIAPAGEGRHDLTMQPSGAAGDELLWHALRDRGYRQIQQPLAPVDASIATDGDPHASAGEAAPRRRAARPSGCRATATRCSLPTGSNITSTNSVRCRNSMDRNCSSTSSSGRWPTTRSACASSTTSMAMRRGTR